MEIVLLLGFADVIFRRERTDDWKYVCGSQAIPVATLRKYSHGSVFPQLGPISFTQSVKNLLLLARMKQQHKL